mmetsp:Transcript_25076/g.49045  ORF Transcript_25076/g.49045 Transcript_25076/m.49045 type:complete len:91 (-) Transcript_25076:267-539(-)
MCSSLLSSLEFPHFPQSTCMCVQTEQKRKGGERIAKLLTRLPARLPVELLEYLSFSFSLPVFTFKGFAPRNDPLSLSLPTIMFITKPSKR